MRAKKVLAVLLAGMLSVSLMTGCGQIDQNATIATVNGTEVSMGLANFYCRLQQATYEDIYKMYLGTDDVWMADPYNSGTNMQDSVKESALTELHEMYTLQAHMGDYGVEITEDDKKAISEAAAKFMSDNTGEAADALGATQEIVEEFLTLGTIRVRMQDAVKAEADANVSDAEANMRGYTQLLVAGDSQSGEEGADAESLKATAVQIETELKAEGATLESVAEAHGLEASKQTYSTYESAEDAEAEDAEEDAVMTALKGMKEGETSGLIEKDGAYYFVRVDSETDAEATESQRQSIITSRQNDHYSEVLDGWQADDGWEIDMSLFGKIQFDTSLTSTDPNAPQTESAQ